MSDKTKTQRLLLNTTPQERAFIQDLLDRSHAANHSELMRAAFEQYLNFHQRVLADEEIVAFTPQGGVSHAIFISKHWQDPAHRGIDRLSEDGGEPLARHTLGIRLEVSFKDRLLRFVSDGYAPSLTALAGAALEVYADVLSAMQAGGEVRSRKPDGSTTTFVDPSRTATVLVPAHPPIVVSGFTPPPTRNILAVLEEEGQLHPEEYVVDAPILTKARGSDVPKKVVEAVLKNLKHATVYSYILDSEDDETDLFEWIKSAIAPKIRWEDILQEKLAVARALFDALDDDDADIRELAKESPAWCLMQAVTFSDKVFAQKYRSEAGTKSLVGRLFNFACWYAKMSDGRLWGYQFTSTGDAGPLQTHLTPMAWETISEQFAKLRQHGHSKLLRPRKLAPVDDKIIDIRQANTVPAEKVSKGSRG